MKKRDLVEFIIAKREQALEERRKEVNAERLQLLKNDLGSEVFNLDHMIVVLNNSLKQVRGTEDIGWSNLHTGLERAESLGIVEYLHNVISYPRVYTNDIDVTFNAILGNIKGMTGPKACEYVESLGFVLPNQPKVENAVLAPVDMNVLRRYFG